jgi:small subunit ribosomal protein S20
VGRGLGREGVGERKPTPITHPKPNTHGSSPSSNQREHNMPQLKGSKKRLRQNRKRAEENKKIKERMMSLVKGAKGKKDLPALYKAVDKAAKRNLLHTNKAARLKSALSKRLASKPSTR